MIIEIDIVKGMMKFKSIEKEGEKIEIKEEIKVKKIKRRLVVDRKGDIEGKRVERLKKMDRRKRSWGRMKIGMRGLLLIKWGEGKKIGKKKERILRRWRWRRILVRRLKRKRKEWKICMWKRRDRWKKRRRERWWGERKREVGKELKKIKKKERIVENLRKLIERVDMIDKGIENGGSSLIRLGRNVEKEKIKLEESCIELGEDLDWSEENLVGRWREIMWGMLEDIRKDIENILRRKEGMELGEMEGRGKKRIEGLNEILEELRFLKKKGRKIVERMMKIIKCDEEEVMWGIDNIGWRRKKIEMLIEEVGNIGDLRKGIVG